MWYLAEILFAEPRQPGRTDYQCESCDVVLRAADAAGAYRKAVAWGEAYAGEEPAGMRLLGVSHLTTIGEELGDGTEVCGRFFRSPAVWERAGGLIPPADRLEAVRWEADRNSPAGELLSREDVDRLRRAWGQES